ncbi:MAG: hypothetical protein AB1921_07385 [Thermodesulfobacteriota bacterium]
MGKPGEQKLPASISGFTTDPERFAALRDELALTERVLEVKEKHPELLPLVVIQGGTGTGKSTLFNAVCGAELSEAGVTRPMTKGPVLNAPQRLFPALAELFAGIGPEAFQPAPSGAHSPTAGLEEKIRAVASDEDFPAVLVDCPDVDSVFSDHEKAARRIFLCADHVLFVATAEKYADAAGCNFLARAGQAEMGVSLAVNKAERPGSAAEIEGELRAFGLPGFSRIFEVGLAGRSPEIFGLERFAKDAKAYLSAQGPRIKKEGLRAGRLLRDRTLRELSDIAEQERAEIEKLEGLLEDALSRSRESLSRGVSDAGDAEARARIHQKLASMFRRYDFFYPLRGAVGKAVRVPARLLGLAGPAKTAGRPDLPHFPRLDPGPLWFALADYQDRVGRSVTDGPLFRALKEKSPQMEPEQARELLNERLSRLDGWLSERFTHLEQGIPKRKKAGIYGLSLAWGALIVSVESVVGGGFTVLDAALDSVLAPLVTAGALEMFVQSEVKELARSLASGIRQAMEEVLLLQHDSYLALLRDLRPA